MEQDPWVSCPYNKFHRVPQSRIQNHIIKCEKNYPPLSICPYNATHRLPDAAMKKHVLDCPSKEIMFPQDRSIDAGYMPKIRPMLQREFIPEHNPRHEIWDEL